jgi:hypothetical protein
MLLALGKHWFLTMTPPELRVSGRRHTFFRVDNFLKLPRFFHSNDKERNSSTSVMD